MATAKECFDDAKQYLASQTDPVMWDVVNGLSALAEQIQHLEYEVQAIRAHLQRS